MANREVSLSICGVVVGILLGAGSVMYVQDMALGASTTDSYSYLRPRGFELIRARDAQNNVMPTNSRAKTIKPMVEPKEDTATVTKKNPSCDAAKDVVAALGATFDKYVAVTLKNTEAREEFAASVEAALAKHCPPVVEVPKPAAPSVKVKPAADQDNDCWRYRAGSTRRTQCEGSENNGEPYTIAE